jgi:hypothetical protein
MNSILAHYVIDPNVRFDFPIHDLSIFISETDSIFLGKPIRSGKIQLDIVEYFYLHLIQVAVSTIQIQPTQQPTPQPKNLSKEIYRKFLTVSLGLPDILDDSVCRWNHDVVADTYLSVLHAHLEYILPTKDTTVEHAYSNSLFRAKASIVCKIGEFVYGLIGKLWIELPAGTTKNMLRLPTIDLIHCIDDAVKHVCKAVCTPLSNNRYVIQASDSSFAFIRPHLYKFLKFYLANWPLDGGFNAIVSLWKSFVAPWQYCSSSSNVDNDASDFWSPYIQNNYLFFVVFFPLIYEHTEIILETVTSRKYERQDFISILKQCIDGLYLTNEVLAKVAGLIRNIEQTEFASGQYLGKKSSAFPDLRLADQISALEPESRFIPTAFDSVSCNHAMNLFRLLDLSQNQVKSYSETLHPAEVELLRKISDCEQRIMEIYQITTELFSLFLSEREAVEIEKSRRSSLGFGSSGSPLSMAKQSSSIFTPRRRQLVPSSPESRLALLKSQKFGPTKKVIRNDEVPILAIFFNWLSITLTRLLRRFLSVVGEKVSIPSWLSEQEVDLRFLAVWQNLLFTFIVLLVLSILLKLIF